MVKEVLKLNAGLYVNRREAEKCPSSDVLGQLFV